jgi:hypothetical protein
MFPIAFGWTARSALCTWEATDRTVVGACRGVTVLAAMGGAGTGFGADGTGRASEGGLSGIFA